MPNSRLTNSQTQPSRNLPIQAVKRRPRIGNKVGGIWQESAKLHDVTYAPADALPDQRVFIGADEEFQGQSCETIVRYGNEVMAIDVVSTEKGEAPKELARMLFPNDRFVMAACLYREIFTIEVIAIAKGKDEHDQTWSIRLDCLTVNGIKEAKRVWSLVSRGFEQMSYETLSWVNLRRENAELLGHPSDHKMQLRERLEHQRPIRFGSKNDILQICLPSSKHPFEFTGHLAQQDVLRMIQRLKLNLDASAEIDYEIEQQLAATAEDNENNGARGDRRNRRRVNKAERRKRVASRRQA